MVMIQQSANDGRLYRHIVLPNGLQAMLISDPEARVDKEDGHSDKDGSECSHEHCSGHSDGESGSEESGSDGEEDDDGDDDGQEQHVKRAAAALVVGTGSFSDPEDVQGLSHYLEHMLFMGSEKYPDENEYDAFLAKHGGSSNAFTEMEFTNYHFEVRPGRLRCALDRFAQFFIAPLCKADALEREVQAVNNEFVGVQQSDGCRLAQLRSHTAAPGHLFRKFTWGNRRSLVEQPAAAGVDVRQRLLTYYRASYGAERMALAVLGGQPLDELEAWVRELFAGVPAGAGPRVDFGGLPRPFQGGRLHLSPAVRQGHELVATFQLPPLQRRYLAKAEDYLSHLVGHEGRSSLLSALKARGWAAGLSAGVPDGGFERSSALSLFEVSVTLTEAGLAAGPGLGLGVAQLLFAYLGLLSREGPQAWAYAELAAIGAMKARFLEEDDAMDYVTGVAGNLLLVAPQHALLSDFLYEDWQPALVSELLGQMTPAAVRLDIQTSDYERLKGSLLAFPGASTSTEPWFDIPFAAAPVPPEQLAAWEAAAAAPPPELALPQRNGFIPTDFSLRCEAAAGAGAARSAGAKRKKQNGAGDAAEAAAAGQLAALAEPPAAVLDRPGCRLWHKLDRAFRTPRACACLQLTSAAAYGSPAAAAGVGLGLKLLADALNETTYMADIAGLQCEVWPEGRAGIEVKVEGFSHKLPLLTRTVLQRLAAFEVPPDGFARVKEAQLRKFRNANLAVDRHATYTRLRCLRHAWPLEAVQAELEGLQPDGVREHMRRALQRLWLEALVAGNVTREEAVVLVDELARLFPGPPLPAAERPQDCVARLPAGASLLLRHRAKNPEEKNSALEVYFQAGEDSLATRALLDLLGQIASEPCFNTLRTREQLGYQVHCGPRLTHNVLGFGFVLLSGSHAPSHLDARVEAFLTAFEGELAALPAAEFERHRQALIAAKLQKDRSMQEQADRHWEQISTRRLQFAAREEEVGVLRGLEQREVLAAYRRLLLPGSPERARLAVHVLGRAHAGELGAAAPEGVQVWEDAEALRAGLPAFPPPSATYGR